MSHHHDHHALVPGNFEVAGDYLRASGPLILPAHRCIRCGSTEPGGEIRNEMVTYVNPWIWLTIFISWIVTWLVYLFTRKQIEVQYYLCPKCSDTRKIRTITSGSITMGALGGIVAAAFLAEWTLMVPLTGAFILGSVAWMVTSSPPLRAIVHDEGTFSLKGASHKYLQALSQHRQLPSHPQRPQRPQLPGPSYRGPDGTPESNY